MRRFAPVFVLFLVLGLAACDGDGGGGTGGGDTIGGTDNGSTGGDEGVNPCAGLETCSLTDAPRCVDGSSYQSCITDANGCTVWSAPVACGAGQACANGQCGACTADCTGRECGDDGCGGSCGTCTVAGETCDDDGQCQGTCAPNCTGKACGDDGCGGTCGNCGAGQTCNAQFQCEGVCTPSCAGRECGTDGCNGSCGNCLAGESCNAQGLCEPVECVPDCTGRACGNDGCGDSCGFCPAGEDCVNGQCQGCVPDCTGRECGPDGCDGSCGPCGQDETCQAGQCIACTPDCTGRDCGGDGCGGTCGACPTGQSCTDGQCVTCTPDCAGKQCGNDGCGGTCGTCAQGLTCLGNTCVCVPSCEGKVCGSNGCGGSCGECGANEACTDLGQCEACTPNCTGRECGDNGCGGSCGPCAAGESCDAAGQCQGGCVADCAGKECGDDGCNGTCGACPTGEVCTTAGLCLADSEGGCADYFVCANECPADDADCLQACYDALTAQGQGRANNLFTCLGERCATCETSDCYNDCAVMDCTLEYGQCFYKDGTYGCQRFYQCYEECGTNQTCVNGCFDSLSPQGFADVIGWDMCLADNCPSCTVADPSAADLEACTTCMNEVAGTVCSAEAEACFATCTPDCTGRVCGNDGCGGTCGTCPAGQGCTAAGQCQAGGGLCVSYFECAQNCNQGDQTCLDACLEPLAPTSAGYAEAYVTCIETNCAECTTEECLNDCIISDCREPYANCFFEAGTDTCGEFYGCLDACGTNQTCQSACFDTVSAEAWLTALAWEDCIVAECPDCATGGANCNTCFAEVTAEGGACIAQTEACYGACEPDCTGKVCGDDGCGGSCGTCGQDERCISGQCAVAGECDHEGFTVVDQAAEHDAANGFLQYFAVNGEAFPVDQFIIEIYQGDFGGPETAGVYELTGPELNYATCGLCVRLFEDATESAIARQYFATAGTVDIDSIGTVGGTFAGTVTGLEMVEVTIEQGTFQSTPVPNGQTWCIPSLPFSSAITAPTAK